MAERHAILDLATSEGPRQFFTIDELRNFLIAEEAFWSQIHHGNVSDSAFNAVASRLQAARATLQREEFSEAALAEVRANFQNIFSGPNALPLSFSQEGAVLKEIETRYGTDAVRSALTLALPPALGVSPTFGQSGQNFVGSVAYLIGMSGLSLSSASAAKEAFRIAAQDAASKASEDRTAVTQLLKEQQSILNDVRLQATIADNTRIHEFTTQRDTIANQATASILAIEETRKAYDEFMHLQGPVAYWKAKHKRHSIISWVLGFLAWGYLSILGFGGAFALWTYRESISQYVLEYRESPGSLLVVSAALALVASIPLWGARILVRFYLSEAHLAADALERVTMTETYLALTKNNAADEKDRAIVLAALFRNAQDGVVKDSTAPDMSLGSLLAKVLDGK